MADDIKKLADAQRVANKAIEEGNSLQKSFGEMLNENIKSSGKLNSIIKNRIDVMRSIDSSIQNQANGQFDTVDLEEKLLSVSEKLSKTYKKNGDINKRFSQTTRDALITDKKGIQAAINRTKTLEIQDKLTGGMSTKARGFAKSIASKPKLAALGLAGVLVGLLVKATTQFSGKIDEVGKTFGFITNKSPEFRNDLIDAGNEAMMVGKNLSDVLAVASSLSSEFGISLSETRDIADTVLDTAVAVGLSTDEATKLFGTFMQIGGLTKDQAENLIESTANLAHQKGVAPTSVLRDMAASSEDIAKFTKGTGENIAEAAVQARQMGLSLSTTARIAEGLLDYENSIAKEVEASVLLGRQLNLQKARELALTNELPKMMEEVVKQVGSQERFNRLLLPQRKALAAALDMDVSQMAKLVKGTKELTLAGALATGNFEQMLKGSDSLSALSSIINSLKMIAASVVDEIGKPLAAVLENLFQKLKDPEGMKAFKNDIIGFVNGISTIINAIMRTIEFVTFGGAFKGDVEDYLIKPIQTQIGGAPSNMQDVVINSSGQQVAGDAISSPFGPTLPRQEITVGGKFILEGDTAKALIEHKHDGANADPQVLSQRRPIHGWGSGRGI